MYFSITTQYSLSTSHTPSKHTISLVLFCPHRNCCWALCTHTDSHRQTGHIGAHKHTMYNAYCTLRTARIRIHAQRTAHTFNYIVNRLLYRFGIAVDHFVRLPNKWTQNGKNVCSFPDTSARIHTHHLNFIRIVHLLIQYNITNAFHAAFRLRQIKSSQVRVTNDCQNVVRNHCMALHCLFTSFYFSLLKVVKSCAFPQWSLLSSAVSLF